MFCNFNEDSCLGHVLISVLFSLFLVYFLCLDYLLFLKDSFRNVMNYVLYF